MLLTDPEVESSLLISLDEGASYQKYSLAFDILSLLFHPEQEDWILAYSHDQKVECSCQMAWNSCNKIWKCDRKTSPYENVGCCIQITCCFLFFCYFYLNVLPDWSHRGVTLQVISLHAFMVRCIHFNVNVNSHNMVFTSTDICRFCSP